MTRTRFRVSAVLLALLGSIAAPAARAEGGFTPRDVARTRSVTQVAMSPDASQIAYVLAVPRRPLEEDDGPGWAELRVVGRDGVSRPFLTGEVNVSEISWTPDGKAVAFLAKRGKDEARSLYTIPVSGGEARRIAGLATEITSYDFSPDGRRVAFLAKEEPPKARKDLEKKGFTQDVVDESAKPVRIWVLSTEDAAAKPKMLDVPGSASDVHWSPVGSRLALALAPTSLVDDALMARRVAFVDADSGAVTRIDNPGKLGPMAWSTDGRTLAFVSAADPNDPAAGRLMAVSADGGPIRDLLPGYEGSVAAIRWQSPDFVMYIGDEGVWTSFGKVRKDGAEKKTIVATGGVILTAFDLARDGKAAAVIGQTPQHPAEVFLLTHEAPVPRRLTTSNDWLAGVRLAPQEVVKFKARDGLALEGLLIRPLDEKAGAKSPLILTVHGGPEAHFRNGWLTGYAEPGQLGAARGIRGLLPELPRLARGAAWRSRSRASRTPPARSSTTSWTRVDHLVAAGVADRAKVGVTGGSYGGYATAWCSTRYSDRFAAGVMFVGISDMVSKARTTDIPNEEYLVHSRKRAWEDWQYKLERSPIYYAEKSQHAAAHPRTGRTIRA